MKKEFKVGELVRIVGYEQFELLHPGISSGDFGLVLKVYDHGGCTVLHQKTGRTEHCHPLWVEKVS